MFDYGVFRLTGAGAPQNIYAGTGPDPAGLGIRYEVAAAKLANGKTQLCVYDGRNEVQARAAPSPTALASLRSDDAPGGDPGVPDAVEPDSRHSGIQLVRHLLRAVLVRHADRGVPEEP